MPVADPANLRARCKCGHDLWKERAGQFTLANRILKLVDGEVHAKCPECGSDVAIPFLQLSDTAPTSRRRLVMRLDPVPQT